MSYKSLLSVVTDDSASMDAMKRASGLASALDAHLDVLCLGVDRSQSGYYYAGVNAAIIQETLAQAQSDAEALEATVRGYLSNTSIRWGVENGVSALSEIARHIGGRARFSDMIVLPQPYGEDRGIESEPVTEGALFDGQGTVLVVPDGTTPIAVPKKVAVAWNESPESLRAIRAALPFLTKAESIHLVVIDPPRHGPTRSDPGGPVSQFLARHGAKAEIDVLSKTLPRVSDVLRRHITDIGADMVVMGAYGHSRFREAILGGATRDMLENSDVPVLMAH